MSSIFYKSILKSSLIFGAIQTSSVFLFLVKAKIISYYLGPSGYGIFGLYTSMVLLLASITNFGLERSSVREIAIASKSGDNKQTAESINIVLKLGLLIGLFSTFLIIVFSKFISVLTFGNDSYTISIIILSFSFFFTSINSAQIAVIRGMQKFKQLAITTLIGSLLGVIISIILIYKFRLLGIGPSFLFSSMSLYLTNNYFLLKFNFEKIKIDVGVLKNKIKNIVFFGLALSVSSSFSILESFVVRIYLRLYGSLNDVGFYSAGFALINSILGIIFTMVVTEFYPKLIQQINDGVQMKNLINQQTEISLIILTPILIFLILSIDLIIPLIYTTEFLAVNKLVFWCFFGLFFKISSLPMSVIFIAKGHTKIIILNEIISNLTLLVNDYIFYNSFGLNGLGIAYFVSAIFNFLQILFVVKMYYSFSFTNKFYEIFGYNLLLLISAGFIYQYFKGFIFYLGSGILIFITIIVSLYVFKKIFIFSEFNNQFKSKRIEAN